MNVKWELLANQVEAKLKTLAMGSPERRKALGALGGSLANRVRLCFRLGVSPWGVPWAPLKHRQGQPLRDTGRLQRSITSEVIGDAAVVGTNVRYARTHQYGATIFPVDAKALRWMTPRGPVFAQQVTIPARPFMPLSAGGVRLPPGWARSALTAMAKSMGL